MLAMVLADLRGVSTTVYAYNNGKGTMLARLAGVGEARLQSEADVVVIEIGVDGSLYRSARLEVTIGALAVLPSPSGNISPVTAWDAKK